jgi:hypothetical protein
MTDQPHQRRILVSIGIEVALAHIDTAFGAQALYGSGFLLAPHDRFRHPAGQQSVLVEFEGVAHDIGDPQCAGYRFGVDRQRR